MRRAARVDRLKPVPQNLARMAGLDGWEGGMNLARMAGWMVGRHEPGADGGAGWLGAGMNLARMAGLDGWERA